MGQIIEENEGSKNPSKDENFITANELEKDTNNSFQKGSLDEIQNKFEE